MATQKVPLAGHGVDCWRDEASIVRWVGMMEFVWVAVGGGVGVASRFGVVRLAAARWGSELPAGTFLVNVSGSFAIGFVMTLLVGRVADPVWRLLLVTGFLGGYTTFSSFSFEIVGLIMGGRPGVAVGYLIASNLLGVIACVAGVLCARLLAG